MVVVSVVMAWLGGGSWLGGGDGGGGLGGGGLGGGDGRAKWWQWARRW